MTDLDAARIEELAEEAALAARAGSHEHAASMLRSAIDIATRGTRALSAVALLRRLFVLDVLDASVAEELVQWHERLGVRSGTIWHAHLADLAGVRSRWPTSSLHVNAYRSTRGILFEVGETGPLCWDQGAVEIAQLEMTAPAQVEVRHVRPPLLTDAMAAACLSVLLPIGRLDDLDEEEAVESAEEEWTLRFVESGRTCGVRGAGDFD
jgi:hypothetical protein